MNHTTMRFFVQHHSHSHSHSLSWLLSRSLLLRVLCSVVGMTNYATSAAQNLTTLNWTQVSQGLPVREAQPRVINVSSLARQENRFAPGTLLYAGTFGAGVYRSVDSGKTWTQANAGGLLGLRVNTLYTNNDVTPITYQIFAGTDAGLFVTEDNAFSWRLVATTINGLTSNNITSITQGVYGGVSMLFVGTNTGVFRSTDGGGRWTNFNLGLPPNTIVSAMRLVGTRLFAGTATGMYAFNLDSLQARDSVNNRRWQIITTRTEPAPISSFLVTPDGNFYAGTNGSGMLLSRDAGLTWQSINRGLENSNGNRVSINSVAVNRPGVITESSRILAAGFSGVFASVAGGSNWTAVNTGFPIQAGGAMLAFNNEIFISSGPNIYRGTVFFARPPVITLVTPSSVPASGGGGRDTAITITGDNFSDPIIFFDGTPLNRISASFSSVRVQLPRDQFRTDGVRRLTLVNIDGQRTEALFTVSGQVSPFIQDISPDSLTVGGSGFDLLVSGQAFDSAASVAVAGVPAQITQRLGRQFLTASVPAAGLAVAGRKFVRVTNTNGQFHDFPFKVRALPPRITEISPPTVSVGNADFQLIIRGAEFFTTANVEPEPVVPLTVRLGGVTLQRVGENSSREVVVNVPRALVSSEATLRLVLTNDDGQFAESRLSVVPFGLSAITTPQMVVCPSVRTQLTSVLTSGVPPYRVVWTNDRGGSVDSSSIDANGVIRAFISPSQPTRYTLSVTDRNGMGVELTQSIQIGILLPQASVPQSIRFDTVNTFFRLSTTQTLRFTNTSPDGTPLTITDVRSSLGSVRAASGMGQTVQAGQFLDLTLTIEPSRDGEITDTVRINFGPCDRAVSTIIRGFRVTPVLPPPVLLAVATAPDGRVSIGAAPPLSWLPVGFLSVPTGYTAQIARVDNGFSTASGFAMPLFSGNVMQATTLQPAFQLQPNTAYAWTVRATNSVTASTWSIPLYFITPPSAQQRVNLVPTRLEFGNTIVGETERRGVQITTMSAQAIDVIGADVFAPQGLPRAAFSLLEQVSPAFRRTPVTARIPANFIATFRPVDTVFHQGVMRFRAASGDTLYALLNGNGVRCVPSGQVSIGEPCAETEIALQFKPFTGGTTGTKVRPDVGDTVTVQLVVRRTSGLDAARYAGRARQFSADIAIGNPDVLFPRNVISPSNLPAAQRTLTRTRIRLQNVPVPASGIQQGNNIVLAEFTGEALLADTLITSLRIAEFTWSDAPGGNAIGDVNIRKILRDTALTVETCVIDGSARLLRLKPAAVLTSLVIAPNPVRGVAETFIRTESATALEITLVNAMGQTVLTEFASVQNAGDIHLSLPMKNLPQGAYMLIVRANREVQQRQIVLIE